MVAAAAAEFMPDMVTRYSRCQVAGVDGYAVTIPKAFTLIARLLPFLLLCRSIIAQAILSSCRGMIHIFWRLAFNGLIHRKNQEEEANFPHPPLVSEKAAIAATDSSSNTSTSSAAPQNERSVWLLDSGASYCVTGNLRALWGIHLTELVSAAAANGQLMWSFLCGRAVGRVNLSGIRYFHGAPMNLISAGFLIRQLGCEIKLNIEGAQIFRDGVLVGNGSLLSNNLFSLDFLDDSLILGEPACPNCPRPHHAH